MTSAFLLHHPKKRTVTFLCLCICLYAWSISFQLALLSVLAVLQHAVPLLACDLIGTIAKLQKKTISFFISVCPSIHPSVRTHKLHSHWTEFHEIPQLSIFRKSVEKIQVSLKSDNNAGCFTCRPIYMSDRISLSSS